MLLFRPSCFTNVKPRSQVLQPPPYSLTTPPNSWSQSILWRLDTWDQDHDFNSLFTNHCNFWAIFGHSPHFSPCPEMRPLPNTLWASPSELPFTKLQCPKSRFPFRWRSNCSLQTPAPWTSHVLFEWDVTDVTDPTLVGSVDYETMSRTCVRRFQELCWNLLITLNCRSEWLL